MNRLKKTLSIILILSLLVSGLGLSSAFAQNENELSGDEVTLDTDFSDISFKSISGFSTVIIDVDGEEHEFNGIIDVEGLEDIPSFEFISSYKVIKNGEVVLDVQIRDVTPDYQRGADGTTTGVAEPVIYESLMFYPELDGKTHEAFIAGLQEELFTAMQEYILDALIQGKNINLENTSFIDTEKEFTSVVSSDYMSDAELCWAGAASNILHYSGWAAKATYNGTNLGLDTEDKVFDLFAESFSDEGGGSDYAFEWFFDGKYHPQNASGYDEWAKVDSSKYSYGTFKGFLPGYGAAGYRKTINSITTCSLNEAFKYLKKGYGEVLNYGFYDGNKRNGGHAISLWGYVIDTSLDVTDPGRYKKIFISDSDSHKGSGDREEKVNVISMCTISHNSSGDYWYINGSQSRRLEDVNLLAPYNTSIEEDTSNGNLFANVDMAIIASKLSKTKPTSSQMGPYLGLKPFAYEDFTENEGAGNIYYTASINGNSEFGSGTKALGFNFVVNLYKVTDSGSTPVGSTYSTSKTINWSSGSSLHWFDLDPIDIVDKFGSGSSKKLEPGNYKLVAKIVTTSGTEAYNNNNTDVIEFTIGGNVFSATVENESTLKVILQLPNVKTAIVAGYNANGKMLFSKYITDASIKSAFTYTRQSDVNKVMLYPINNTYGSDGTVITLTRNNNTFSAN